MSEDTVDITDRLRNRACPAGLPHTGDTPWVDHGHTDCWLFHMAAREIDSLREQIRDLTCGEDSNDSYPRGFEHFLQRSRR